MATATTLEAFPTIEHLLDALGGISPGRVRLHPLPGTATEADLIEFNGRKLTLYELVDGVLVEKGMSYRESLLAAAIISFLREFVIARNLGLISAPDGMMRLFPGLVRLPDVALVSWDRIPGRRVPSEPIAGFAPDLAVEILSPSNTGGEMARKRWEYFQAGVRLVWEVNPEDRTVAVHDAPERSTVLDRSRTLEGGDVQPGFSLPLGHLFAEPDRHDA